MSAGLKTGSGFGQSGTLLPGGMDFGSSRVRVAVRCSSLPFRQEDWLGAESRAASREFTLSAISVSILIELKLRGLALHRVKCLSKSPVFNTLRQP